MVSFEMAQTDTRILSLALRAAWGDDALASPTLVCSLNTQTTQCFSNATRIATTCATLWR